jgi:hypothetical protein
MWDENFRFLLLLMLMGILFRIAYELETQPKTKAVSMLPETHPIQNTTEISTITSQQRKWSEKAVKRYSEAQEKKWRRWNEAMFERQSSN